MRCMKGRANVTDVCEEERGDVRKRDACERQREGNVRSKGRQRAKR